MPRVAFAEIYPVSGIFTFTGHEVRAAPVGDPVRVLHFGTPGVRRDLGHNPPPFFRLASSWQKNGASLALFLHHLPALALYRPGHPEDLLAGTTGFDGRWVDTVRQAVQQRSRAWLVAGLLFLAVALTSMRAEPAQARQQVTTARRAIVDLMRELSASITRDPRDAGRKQPVTLGLRN